MIQLRAVKAITALYNWLVDIFVSDSFKLPGLLRPEMNR